MAGSNDALLISSQLAAPLAPFGVGAGGDRRLKLVVSVRRFRDRLEFNFALGGRGPMDLEGLVLPEPTASRKRKDELWKTTCLELFVGGIDRKAYVEMNLSPCGDWNIYAFDAYREGMRAVQAAREPLVKRELSTAKDLLTWSGVLASAEAGDELGSILTSPGLVLGATAVLEYRTGTREYWALAHAGDKPDFHLRESFRLRL